MSIELPPPVAFALRHDDEIVYVSRFEQSAQQARKQWPVDLIALVDRAALLNAIADRAAEMSRECNPNVPAGFPLIDLMNELRAAAGERSK